MQIIGLYPELLNQKLWGKGPNNFCFNKISGGLRITALEQQKANQKL